MRGNIIEWMQCPSCPSSKQLSYLSFDETKDEEIINGVVWCDECRNWYPIENYLLDFLPVELSYSDDRQQFWGRYATELKQLHLEETKSDGQADYALQYKQQTHFDWYANSDEQTYLSYEQTPFWISADKIAFDEWREMILPKKWLIDVGCAQGRSTFKLMDFDINIVAFDISKRMIRQAIDRYKSHNYKAKAVFFTADATKFPFINECFDYVLLYGVLHHLPNPKDACREIARILKPGGIYFGEENNDSSFRKIFDLLQNINPMWHEEAGPEHLFSEEKMKSYFENTGVEIESKTSIFFPPHIINLFSQERARRLLEFSDHFLQSTPFFSNNGGVILVQGKKK